MNQPLPALSAAELSVIVRGLSWQQRAALRVLVRTPSRIRQRDDGSLYVDTQSSSPLPLVTFRALERKGLAHRDHEAHPASSLGQRIAPTSLGLFALARFTGLAFPPSAARLWPSHPPKHLTAAPASLPPLHRPDRGSRPCR